MNEPSFHSQIMNLPLGDICTMPPEPQRVYRHAHKNARHAAAEIAARADARIAELEATINDLREELAGKSVFP